MSKDEKAEQPVRYTIVSASPEGDQNAMVIEQRGKANQFTVGELRSSLTDMGKRIKELKAQKELEDAKIVNFTHFHPFLLELSAEDMNTVKLYLDAKAISDASATALAKYTEAMEETAADIEEIKKQTGVEI